MLVGSRRCPRSAWDVARTLGHVLTIALAVPTAVETTGIGRSVGRNDFGLRFFFAAMGVLFGRLRPPEPDPDASLSG